MNNSTLDIIKTILDNQMNMPPKRVWAYNGTQDLPQDNGLFIVLSFMARNPYSNNSKYKPTEDGLEEVQSVNMAEDILISLISKNTDARDRAFEVPMALKSSFSQYTQDLNSIHISTIGEVRDSSFLESTSRLNRWDITCRVMRAYEKTQSIDYYDKYPITSQFEPNYLFD